MVTRDIVQRLLNVINDTRRRVNTLESREYVLLNATQTLTNKTLTTPTIGDFSNAQHSHANAAGGGQLSLTTAVSGILPPANGGTGVNNATRTLTINTNSGTLAFSGAGYTLTIPKTGTVPVGTGTAGRIAEWVTDANTVQASTLAKTGAGVLTLSAAANYTLTIPATGTAALLGTANVFTAAQTIQPSSNSTATLAVNDSGGTRLLTVDTTNQRVGVGTNAPSEALTVVGRGIFSPSSASRLGDIQSIMEINGDFGSNAPLYIFDSRSAIYRSGGNMTFGGYTNGTATPKRFAILGGLKANATAGNETGMFWFMVNRGAGVDTFNPAMVILGDSGNVGVNETTPTAQLQVEQTSTTAAKPALRLQQADLSEEFIRFDATVGAGNPINTTALGAYYGRVRVYVEGVGAKWLALYD